MSEFDDWMSPCEEQGDHRDYKCVDLDELMYRCDECGAEWWEDDQSND